MKKILIAIAIFSLLLVCLYIFIPSKIDISSLKVIGTPASAVYRCVNNENMWSKWDNLSYDPAYKKYIITGAASNVINVLINDGKDSINSTINLLTSGSDSMIAQWQCFIESGLNPLARIYRYSEAISIKKNMDSVLERLKTFASKSENIYGFKIHESSTKDTLLISTKANFYNNPSTNDIYILVNKLKKYATELNAHITGYPMYNITSINGDTLRLKVAIPVNKPLQATKEISPVRMIPGKFIVGEVTGGEQVVQNAFAQLQNYFADYGRSSMAIPFAYLITDRSIEPDTSKWITKVFVPAY